MAIFEIAYKKTLAHEGGYVNDPDDSGGETYKGVARAMHKDWTGWAIIDAAKNDSTFPKNLDNNEKLNEAIQDFYEKKFWNPIKATDIQSQLVAESIFDFGVNAGVKTSAKLAQKVVGVVQDGSIGPITLRALNSFNKKHFLSAFIVEKIRRYVEIIEKRPVTKKYLYGWIRRALEGVK